MTHDEKLIYLIKYLLAEDIRYKDIQIPKEKSQRFDMFRNLVNIRPPKPASDEFIRVQDEFLREETAAKGISDIADMQPVEDNIYISGAAI